MPFSLTVFCDSARSCDCCRNVIIACSVEKKWDLVVALLQEMLSVGVEPDAACFQAGIVACRWCGLWEQALVFLREMPTLGITPTVRM